MQRILVWDIPTRLFHALFASSFIAAFAIAELVDDDSPSFKLHMLLGGLMAFMVALRVIWGLVGSRWARFGTFLFGPSAVIAYFKGILSRRDERHVGHNPGSSWGIFAMLALALGLAITGAQMSTGGDVVEELHEVFAFAMLALVGMHVAGVTLHTLLQRDNIVLSMIVGHKQGDPKDAIAGPHAVVGLVFLALTAAWGYGLVSSYDPAANQVTLPLLGTTIGLGENEGGEGEGEGGRGHDDERDERDDE